MPRRASTGSQPVPERRHQAVVIGCSAGGVRALGGLLGRLDARLAVPVIVVCHVGGEDVEMLCEVLSLTSRLPLQEAAERHCPAAGQVYVAPAGYHLLIERDGCFGLSVDARVQYSRPSIDVLFSSAAEHYRERLIGVVLTGANDDGARGLQAIRARGGLALVQHPDDAEVPQMPLAAIALAGADHIAPLSDLASLIHHHCPP